MSRILAFLIDKQYHLNRAPGKEFFRQGMAEGWKFRGIGLMASA